MTAASSARDLPRIVSASFKAGATAADQFPPPTVAEVAFAGRSNVGKSSLLNCLLERKSLMRTSSTPGCTRQVNFLDVRSQDDSALVLVDLPGYGYAKRSKTERRSWGTLIESYLLGRPTLSGVALLVDVRRGLEDEEHQLLELLHGPARVSRRPLNVIVVATKLDKLPSSQRKLALTKLAKDSSQRIVGFSAKEQTGRDELWRRVRQAAGLDA
ncbi:MAG TPA: ribosome biogenesis GTP-binding protein YihA/YsxC [Polyangiaceae bacterium]|nr:ribosome biogenesis GTP-binding protein YihA/YsxC [Polyangiaceae bacterium]